MDTSKANIWYSPQHFRYLIYSPEHGVTDILEMYVGVWGSGVWYKSDSYKNIDELELDAVHFDIVPEEGLRETLLKTAIDFFESK